MTIVRLLQSASLAIVLSSAGHAQSEPRLGAPDPADPPGAEFHFAKARQIAGEDPYLIKWIDSGPLCKSPQVHKSMMEAARAPGKVTPHAPAQLFDNFYMVGNSYVVSLILKTSAGLVMWDTMNNADDAKNVIEAGMDALGLNPADVKYIILTMVMATTTAVPNICKTSTTCRSERPKKTGTSWRIRRCAVSICRRRAIKCSRTARI